MYTQYNIQAIPLKYAEERVCQCVADLSAGSVQECGLYIRGYLERLTAIRHLPNTIGCLLYAGYVQCAEIQSNGVFELRIWRVSVRETELPAHIWGYSNLQNGDRLERIYAK